MKKVLFFIIFSMSLLHDVATGQNPYQSIGKPMPKGKMLTLSDGKFQEFFPNDTLVPIGSVMYNTITGQVVAFLTRDTLYTEYNLEPEVVSRWLSPDPLAAKYPNHSPYVFTYNNPIVYMDPDGQEGILVINKDAATITVKATYVVEIGKEGMSREAYQQLLEINKTLNDQKYTVTDEASPYKGYTVVFDLQFTPAVSEKMAQGMAVSEEKLVAGGHDNKKPSLIVDGKTIANSIVVMDDASYMERPDTKAAAEKAGVTVDKIGATTTLDLQHTILPKSSEMNRLYKIHEIFHTLYFDKDGSKTGIASGTALPTPGEINELIGGFIKENRTTDEKK